MASDLRAFLSQNAVGMEHVQYATSPRFQNADGTPVNWEIRPINTEEDKRIRSACTVRVPVPGGKKGLFTNELDVNAYNSKLAATCTVFPPLNNKELQDSYGVMGEEALLNRMLLPGEFFDYLQKVQEVCGFDVSFDEKVEAAKN